MKDLFVNFIGAVVFSVIGYFYVKNRGKGRFAGGFIPRLKTRDADFLEQAEEEMEACLEPDIRSADQDPTDKAENRAGCAGQKQGVT